MTPEYRLGSRSRLSLVAVAIAMAACSSSTATSTEPQPSDGSDAGGPGGAGGMAEDGGTRSNDPCSAAGTPTPVVLGVTVSALRFSGKDLVFVDDNGGTGAFFNSRSIRKVATDGTGGVVLYTGPADKQIVNINATADTVYFLQNESTIDSSEANLYRVPSAGGAAERVSPGAGMGFPPDATIFAVDATNAYVHDTHDFIRVTLATGEQTVVTSFDVDPTDPQLVGDTIWFASLQGLDGVFSVPANGNAATATRAGKLTCGPSAVTVSKDGIFCAIPGGVSKSALDGSGETKVASSLTLNYTLLLPSPPDGDNIYVYGGGFMAPIYRLPTAGGALTPVACNRGQIVQFAYAPDAIYWAEKSEQMGGATRGIYRLAKTP